jgi:hypothetical protein
MKSFNLSENEKPLKAFGLGTVITKVGKKGSNKQVHGKIVTIDDLDNQASESKVLKLYKGKAVNSLLKDARNGAFFDLSVENISEQLELNYGLQCYKAVLEHFAVPYLRVCGTGLRYGVFFRIAYDEWNNVKSYED